MARSEIDNKQNVWIYCMLNRQIRGILISPFTSRSSILACSFLIASCIMHTHPTDHIRQAGGIIYLQLYLNFAV